MTIRRVMDTSALIAHRRNEPGFALVDNALRAGGCALHAGNLCEFCFTAPRKTAEFSNAHEALRWVNRIGLDVYDDMDADFLLPVAEIRSRAPALSLGDGLAVALALRIEVPVMTADRAFARASVFARIELIR